MTITCAFCGTQSDKDASAVNRAMRIGAALFCNRICAGMQRRKGKTREQCVAEKAEYDRQYRAASPTLKTRRHAHHLRTYDPEKARKRRQTIRDWHRAYAAEYRSRVEWKAHKVEYDLRRRAADYADFAEAWRLLIDLEKEIRARCPDKYERQKARGYFTRIQERQRNDRQERQSA